MSLGVIPLPDRPERIDGFVLKSSYDRLQAENTKLRELVIELYEDQVEGYDEWKYIESLRELGIEVDE